MPEAQVAWTSLLWPGFEHLRLSEGADGAVLDGWALVVLDGEPLRFGYEVCCDGAWRVRAVRIARSGPHPSLALEADGEGRWHGPKRDELASLAGCTDVDLAITPATNTLPIRRLRLAPGESREVRAAYVAFPALTLRPMPQRYTRLGDRDGHAVYRYESRTFQADLEVNEHGLVLDYPGYWRRQAPRG